MSISTSMATPSTAMTTRMLRSMGTIILTIMMKAKGIPTVMDKSMGIHMTTAMITSTKPASMIRRTPLSLTNLRYPAFVAR